MPNVRFLCVVVACVGALVAQLPSPLPPLPEPRHLRWHALEMNAFVHFGPNTFTGVEWGTGKEKAEQFRPEKLDALQWVKAFKSAGLRGVVVTAKHHDGFCLWPTRHSTHSVAASPWQGGRGDVLRELARACREESLLFGVYLSPWDRNHPTYGTDAYNDVFCAMLEEVLTSYGPVFEVWFDGACGEGPNGKRQVYDWPRYVATVRKHAPDAVIFSDAGPDIRWVGNEKGFAPETCWSPLERDRFVPGTDLAAELGPGHEKGTHWVPAECDVSIRPGWFWRAAETPKVKDGATLFDLYERSVGRNANFLLNVPPTTAGVVDAADVKALADFGRRVREVYGTNLAAGATGSGTSEAAPAAGALDGDPTTAWAAKPDDRSPAYTLTLKQPTTFNRIRLAEAVTLGQRIRAFKIEARIGGTWTAIANGTTVGTSRILATAEHVADALRVSIVDARATPTLATISLHRVPPSESSR